MREKHKSIDDSIPPAVKRKSKHAFVIKTQEHTFIDLFLLLKAFYEKLPIIFANIRV
jgi:hypothetical protein